MAMTKSRVNFNLQHTLGTGAAAATNIAVAGIATDDEIVAVIEWTTTASIATMADVTSEASITSAGNVQLSTTNSTNNTVQIFWIDTSL